MANQPITLQTGLNELGIEGDENARICYTVNWGENSQWGQYNHQHVFPPLWSRISRRSQATGLLIMLSEAGVFPESIDILCSMLIMKTKNKQNFEE